MFKCKTNEVAKSLALEHNVRCYGMSVLDGRWYVGTEQELNRIGAQPIVANDNDKGTCSVCRGPQPNGYHEHACE